MDKHIYEVGVRIKQIRKKTGLNQTDFAKLIGATLPAVSNWETGKNLPNNERLKAISQIGEISVDELLHGNKKLYLSEAIEKELNSAANFLKSEYLLKYKNTLTKRIILDLEKYNSLQKLSYKEIDAFVKKEVENYALNAFTDTEDMVFSLIDELYHLTSKIKLYTGKVLPFSDMKVDEIDIEIAEKVIEYLDEASKKINQLEI